MVDAESDTNVDSQGFLRKNMQYSYADMMLHKYFATETKFKI